MSEDGLRSILQRVQTDQEFAQQLRSDPTAALAKVELSSVERFALTCGDQDALRRLQGQALADGELVEQFSGAALASFDDREVGRMLELSSTVMFDAACSSKTTKVTSSTVTKCCWG